MRILGIDPGLQHTGWGVIESNGDALRFIAAGVINTSPKDEMADRLITINKSIIQIVEKYMPEYSAIEETYVNKNFGSSLKLSHARAAAILTLGLQGLSPAEYAAKTIKKTLVGSGAAEKQQIMQMLGFLMPGIKITNQDASDAVAIAVCHSRFIRPITGRLNIANF